VIQYKIQVFIDYILLQTYPSPREEIAVFGLNQKEWYLKRAAPSPTVS
jgi:hypothetical protein